MTYPPIYSTCSPVITDILTSTSTEFDCLSPVALNDFATLGSKNASLADVKGAVETWLTEFCSVGACSADTLNDIAAKVGAGCSATGDPGAFNSSDFALVREVMCLKECTAANAFCTTESITATNFETNGASPAEMLFGLIIASSVVTTPCTECTKARYQAGVKVGIADFQQYTDCGANFTVALNSSVVGVAQTAVAADFKVKYKNSADALTPGGLVLLAVTGLFAVL
ncbi:hypothetical protein B0H14DRAFT_3601300 [Mycena olivaceomarginata]|nr:hypothetical protein B0H14DRAFT_3601300 [Mycena olivaceomarginata]